jgi:hypothetical protein
MGVKRDSLISVWMIFDCILHNFVCDQILGFLDSKTLSCFVEVSYEFELFNWV